MGIFPKYGWKLKNYLSCHHLVDLLEYEEPSILEGFYTTISYDENLQHIFTNPQKITTT